MKIFSVSRIVLSTLLLVSMTGCGGVGLAVVGSALGLTGSRGLEYYDSGEITHVLYVDGEHIEKAVVQSFNMLDYTLATKYLLSGGEIEYEGYDNVAEEDDRVDISVVVNTLAPDINEVTISARKGVLQPEKSVCHVLMSEIMKRVETDQQKFAEL